MQLVLNNPYRAVGLLVGATAREQERQIKRLKQFIEAEQEPDADFSFPTLGNLNRTLDIVTEATSKLNLDSDKMMAALFWFYKGNEISDEPALESIKTGDLDEVLNIWTKLTPSNEVTKRNASAFNNLGTIYLSGVLEGTDSNESLLEKGISLKLKFLESDYAKELKLIATDETFKTTKKDLQLNFLKNVQKEIEKSQSISSNQFVEILNKQEFTAKIDFLQSFVTTPIQLIENEIELSKNQRKANKSKALQAGKELLKKTAENLSQLKSIFGKANIKYSSLSDKVSDEVLQCGIDYFSFYKDSEKDPGSDVMSLFKKAKTLAIGNIAKQRCDENTENLQDWIEDKPNREIENLIREDAEKIISFIDFFAENKEESIANSETMINCCYIHLQNIKTKIGSQSEIYLSISTKVAGQAQHFIITEVNNFQKKIESQINISRKTAMENLLLVLVKANSAMKNIDSNVDMDSNFRSNFIKNKSKLEEMIYQIFPPASGGPSKRKSPSTTESEGFDFPKNAWWILGLIGAIIGAAISDNMVGVFIGGAIGAFIGSKLSE